MPCTDSLRERIGPAALLAALLVGAPASGDATGRDWPPELGPVLSWAPPSLNRDADNCGIMVDRHDPSTIPDIQIALDRALPGDVICVASTDHRDELLQARNSGARGAPVVLRSLRETVIAGAVVAANDIVISGFTVDNAGTPHPEGRGAGFHLSGTRLGLIANTIREPGGYGIDCDRHGPRCDDVAIIANTIRDVDGIGINAVGENILIEGNDVAGSVRIEAGDADGIRFHGERILIRHNYVHHIFDRDYPGGDGPHTDCFQTFDSGRPTTRNVVIEANICFDVDHQCLMAETPVRNAGRGLIFRGNICANNGSQGVLVRDFEDVEIAQNIFLPTLTFNAVVLRQDVVGARLQCNLSIGRHALHQIDETSNRNLVLTSNRRVETPGDASSAYDALQANGCDLPDLEPWLERTVDLARRLGNG